MDGRGAADYSALDRSLFGGLPGYGSGLLSDAAAAAAYRVGDRTGAGSSGGSLAAYPDRYLAAAAAASAVPWYTAAMQAAAAAGGSFPPAPHPHMYPPPPGAESSMLSGAASVSSSAALMEHYKALVSQSYLSSGGTSTMVTSASSSPLSSPLSLSAMASNPYWPRSLDHVLGAGHSSQQSLFLSSYFSPHPHSNAPHPHPFFPHPPPPPPPHSLPSVLPTHTMTPSSSSSSSSYTSSTNHQRASYERIMAELNREALLQHHHSAAVGHHPFSLGLHPPHPAPYPLGPLSHHSLVTGDLPHPPPPHLPSPLGGGRESNPGSVKQERTMSQESATVKEEPKRGDGRRGSAASTSSNSSSPSSLSQSSRARHLSGNNTDNTVGGGAGGMVGKVEDIRCNSAYNNRDHVMSHSADISNIRAGLGVLNAGNTQSEPLERPVNPPPPLPQSPLRTVAPPRVLCTPHSVDDIIQVPQTNTAAIKDEQISPNSNVNQQESGKSKEDADTEDTEDSSSGSDSDNSDSESQDNVDKPSTDSSNSDVGILTVDNDSQSSVEQIVKVDTDTTTAGSSSAQTETDSSSNLSGVDYAPIKVEPVENRLERPERNPKNVTKTIDLTRTQSNKSPHTNNELQIKKEQISPKSTTAVPNPSRSPNPSRNQSPSQSRNPSGESEPRLKTEVFTPRPVSRNFSLPSFQYSISPPASTTIGPAGRKVHATTFMPQVGTLPSPTATTASGKEVDEGVSSRIKMEGVATNGHHGGGHKEVVKINGNGALEDKSKAVKGKKGSPPTVRRNVVHKDPKPIGKAGNSGGGIVSSSKGGKDNGRAGSTNPALTSPLLLSTLSNVPDPGRKTPSSSATSYNSYIPGLPASTSSAPAPYMLPYGGLYSEEERKRLIESGWGTQAAYFYYNADLSPRSASQQRGSVTSTATSSAGRSSPPTTSQFKSDSSINTTIPTPVIVSSATTSAPLPLSAALLSGQEVYTVNAGLHLTTGGHVNVRARSPPPPLLPPTGNGLLGSGEKSGKPVILPPVPLSLSDPMNILDKTGVNRKGTPTSRAEDTATTGGSNIPTAKVIALPRNTTTPHKKAMTSSDTPSNRGGGAGAGVAGADTQVHRSSAPARSYRRDSVDASRHTPVSTSTTLGSNLVVTGGGRATSPGYHGNSSSSSRHGNWGSYWGVAGSNGTAGTSSAVPPGYKMAQDPLSGQLFFVPDVNWPVFGSSPHSTPLVRDAPTTNGTGSRTNSSGGHKTQNGNKTDLPSPSLPKLKSLQRQESESPKETTRTISDLSPAPPYMPGLPPHYAPHPFYPYATSIALGGTTPALDLSTVKHPVTSSTANSTPSVQTMSRGCSPILFPTTSSETNSTLMTSATTSTTTRISTASLLSSSSSSSPSVKSSCTMSTQTESNDALLDSSISSSNSQMDTSTETRKSEEMCTQTSDTEMDTAETSSESVVKAKDIFNRSCSLPDSQPIIGYSHNQNNRRSFDTLLEIAGRAFNNSSHDVPTAISSTSTCTYSSSPMILNKPQISTTTPIQNPSPGEGLHLLSMLAEFTQKHAAISTRSSSPDINQNYNGPKADYFTSPDYIPPRKRSLVGDNTMRDAIEQPRYPIGSAFNIGTGIDNMSPKEIERVAAMSEIIQQRKDIQKDLQRYLHKLQPKKTDGDSNSLSSPRSRGKKRSKSHSIPPCSSGDDTKATSDSATTAAAATAAYKKKQRRITTDDTKHGTKHGGGSSNKNETKVSSASSTSSQKSSSSKSTPKKKAESGSKQEQDDELQWTSSSCPQTDDEDEAKKDSGSSPVKKSLSFSPGFKSSWGSSSGLGVLAQYGSPSVKAKTPSNDGNSDLSIAAATSAALKNKKRKMAAPDLKLLSSEDTGNKKKKTVKKEEMEKEKPATKNVNFEHSFTQHCHRFKKARNPSSSTATTPAKEEKKPPKTQAEKDEWCMMQRRSERIFLSEASVISPPPPAAPSSLSPGCSAAASSATSPSPGSSTHPLPPPTTPKPKATAPFSSPKPKASPAVNEVKVKATVNEVKVKAAVNEVKVKEKAQPNGTEKERELEKKKKVEEKPVNDKQVSQEKPDTSKEEKSKFTFDEKSSEDSSSEENLPLSTLRRERSITPEPRSCELQIEELVHDLKVLFFRDSLFYEATLKVIDPPNIYGLLVTGERRSHPHILPQDEVLKVAVLDIAPQSLRYLEHGHRVCAYWSQKYSCLYPGTVQRDDESDEDDEEEDGKIMLTVEFDDGDLGKIPIEHVRLLPQDFPIQAAHSQPTFLGKRRRRTASEELMADCRDRRPSVSDTCYQRPLVKKTTTPKTKKREETSASGRKMSLDHMSPICEKEEGVTSSSTTSKKLDFGESKRRKSEESKKKKPVPVKRSQSVAEGFGGSSAGKNSATTSSSSGDLSFNSLLNDSSKSTESKKTSYAADDSGSDSDTSSSSSSSSGSNSSSSSSTSSSGSSSTSSSNDSDSGNSSSDDSDTNAKPAKTPSKKTAKKTPQKPQNKMNNKMNNKMKGQSKATFVPGQPWKWYGPIIKRTGKKGKAKKDFIFYKAIQRGKEIIEVGDCAVFLSDSLKPSLPFIGRIEELWEETQNMMVRVFWFYHPEEAKGGKKLAVMEGALYFSDHEDTNDVQTIHHRCQVMSFTKWKRWRKETIDAARANGTEPNLEAVFYNAGLYQPTKGLITFAADVKLKDGQ